MPAVIDVLADYMDAALGTPFGRPAGTDGALRAIFKDYILGKTDIKFHAEIYPEHTVLKLKETIAKWIEDNPDKLPKPIVITPTALKVVFKGRLWSDQDTVLEMGVGNGDTIYFTYSNNNKSIVVSIVPDGFCQRALS